MSFVKSKTSKHNSKNKIFLLSSKSNQLVKNKYDSLCFFFFGRESLQKQLINLVLIPKFVKLTFIINIEIYLHVVIIFFYAAKIIAFVNRNYFENNNINFNYKFYL